MPTTPVEQWCEEIAYDLGYPIYRHINVTRNAQGKKMPQGEKNNMSIAELKTNRGLATGNSISMYIKYVTYDDVPLYIADFDTKELEGCAFWKFLQERKAPYTQSWSQKGYHSWIFVKDVPKELEKQQQRVLLDGTDMDFLRTNNAWYRKGTLVHNPFPVVLEWKEIESFFDTARMRGSNAPAVPHPMSATAPVAAETNDLPESIARYVRETFKVEPCVDWKWQRSEQQNKRQKKHVVVGYIKLGKTHCPAGATHSSNHQYLHIYRDVDTDEITSVKLKCMGGSCRGASKDVTGEALNYTDCQEWNKRCAYIRSSDSFMCTVNGHTFPVQNERGVRNVMAEFTTSGYTVSDWLAHEKARRYQKIGFYPKLDPTPQELPADTFNLFQGLGIPEDKAELGDVTPLTNHIRDIVCAGNDEHYNYFMNCLAQIVQTPWKRLNACVVLLSEEGAGKTIIFQNFMRDIIGERGFLTCSDPNVLFGDFNASAMSGKLMVCAEELVYAGSKRDASRLKDYITSDYITCNQKFQATWEEQNFANIFVLSNGADHRAVDVGMKARRYFVLECKNTYAGPQTDVSRAYFERILKIESKHFAYYLYNRDITDFNSRNIPQTRGTLTQQVQSLSAVPSAFYECLQRGYILEREDDAFPNGHVDWDSPLFRSKVFKSLNKEFGHLRGWPDKPQSFWHQLKMLLGFWDPNPMMRYLPKKLDEGFRGEQVAFEALSTLREWWSEHHFTIDCPDSE